MAVTDDQVAALRAFLSAGTEAQTRDTERQFLTLARTGRADEMGALVYGAFAAAARRRFSPAWTCAGIVRFVVGFRGSSAEAAELVSPSAAENQLRGILGDQQAARPPEQGRASAQVLLSRRSHLRYPHCLVRPDIVVEVEAGLAGAEVLRGIDIADGDGNGLEPHVRDALR